MEIKKEVARVLKSVLKDVDVGKYLEVPPQPELGDLAFTCFDLAKIKKRNPKDIAVDIVDKIKLPKDSLVDRIEVKGGYVNFFFDWKKISEKILKEILTKKENYGKPTKIEKKKIMIEFAHPNTHKGLHIGHFRNICLGESLCRVLEFSGHKIFRVNYQGDIGPHIAKALWAFVNIYGRKVPKEKEKNKAEWLGELYAETERRMQDEKVANEVAEINKKLYAGDKEIIKLWQETRKWSLDSFDEIYRELGTKFDKLYFESEVGEKGMKIAENALKKGIAKESEGAVIIDLEKYGLGIFVLVSKEKTPLYPAKDLELAELQFSDFKIDKCIHVVSTEQNLYFKQLFKTFELINSPGANKSYHLAYELVTLKEGKMASRLGNVVLYSQLRDKIIEKVLEEMKDRKIKNKEETAKAIGIGAMKYGMLKISPEKVIFFDWQDALKLEGSTGPYLQYAHTRCKGILEKAGKWKPNFKTGKLTEEEKELVKILSRFSETVEQATKDLRPHYICNYAYDLATAFDRFYEFCPVLKAETAEQKNFRLALVQTTKIVLKNAMGLIGMESLEKM
jgi:arginyl-tRNA synthetase